jgi:hypothetical protein
VYSRQSVELVEVDFESSGVTILDQLSLGLLLVLVISSRWRRKEEKGKVSG